MPRFLNRSMRVALDIAVLSLAYWVAWLFRFEFVIPYAVLDVAAETWPVVIGLQFVMILVFSVPRMAWRYISIRDAQRVLVATSSAGAILVTLRLLRLLPQADSFIPLGVLAMDFVLGFLGLVGVRAAWRVHN